METDSPPSLQKGPTLPILWSAQKTDFDFGTERDDVFVALSHYICGNLSQQQ